MKRTSNRVYGFRYSILYYIFLLSLLYTPVHARGKIEVAKENYDKGFYSFYDGNYGLAKGYFMESYNEVPLALTAYFLSCTCVRLENPTCAASYAWQALNSIPPLSERYKSHALKIKEWASKAKNDRYYFMKGTGLRALEPNLEGNYYAPTYLPPYSEVPSASEYFVNNPPPESMEQDDEDPYIDEGE